MTVALNYDVSNTTVTLELDDIPFYDWYFPIEISDSLIEVLSTNYPQNEDLIRLESVENILELFNKAQKPRKYLETFDYIVQSMNQNSELWNFNKITLRPSKSIRYANRLTLDFLVGQELFSKAVPFELGATSKDLLRNDLKQFHLYEPVTLSVFLQQFEINWENKKLLKRIKDESPFMSTCFDAIESRLAGIWDTITESEWENFEDEFSNYLEEKISSTLREEDEVHGSLDFPYGQLNWRTLFMPDEWTTTLRISFEHLTSTQITEIESAGWVVNSNSISRAFDYYDQKTTAHKISQLSAHGLSLAGYEPDLLDSTSFDKLPVVRILA